MLIIKSELNDLNYQEIKKVIIIIKTFIEVFII